jgi:hypothetical protein
MPYENTAQTVFSTHTFFILVHNNGQRLRKKEVTVCKIFAQYKIKIKDIEKHLNLQNITTLPLMKTTTSLCVF